MRSKIKKLLKEEFAKNLLTMITGNVIAQAIPILANLILARLYTPAELGAYVFFISLINTLAIIASFKYNEAIVLSPNEKTSYGLLYLSLILTCLFSIVLLVILLILNSYIVDNIEYPTLNKYLYFIPLGVVLLSIFTTFNFFNNYKKEYKIIASTRVSQNLVTSITQISAFALSISGLIIGYFTGLFISIVQTLKMSKSIKLKMYSRKMIIYVFYKYINFAKFYMPTAFINKLSYSLPILMLPVLFDMSEAGYFSYSTLIVLGPMGIISSSMQQVFYQKIATMYIEKQNLYSYVLKTYKKLFIIGIFPHIILFIFAPLIFKFLFGSQWEISGIYTRYLTPWFFMIFMNSSVSSLYVIKGKQKEYLVFEMVIVIVRVLSLLLGYYTLNSGEISVIAYGAVGFIYECFICAYFFKISRE